MTSPQQGAPSTLLTRVVNDQGRAFNVVLVRSGDRYGRGGACINESSEPMIEFYDATYENDDCFDKGRGQFVSRYYLSTLSDRGSGSVRRSGFIRRSGLNLCGHEPAWKVTGQNLAEVLAAVEAALRGVSKDADRVSREDRERAMFGCTAAAIDEVITAMVPRDVALYAMGTLSNAQELIRRADDGGWAIADRDADTIRTLINIAKYAMDKAVSR